jgi:hypothetical protein
MLLNIDDREKIERAAGDIPTEEFLMGDGRPQPNNNDPQLDEAVWNAWVKKNEIKEKIRYARRRKVFGIILVLGIVLLLAWRFTQ